MDPLAALTDRDLARLARRGLDAEEIRRQLARLAAPARPVRLDRPATVGDGIERLTPARAEGLAQRAESARRAGRLSKLVPASGAATRMFAALAAVVERGGSPTPAELATAAATGDAAAAAAARFLEILPRLALARPLAAARGVSVEELGRRALGEPVRPLLAAVLETARRPKALLPFHAAGDELWTAFEEQLREGLAYLADATGTARFHFTVASESLEAFERALDAARARLPGGDRLEVRFSTQDPATDTLALDTRDGRPARREDGSLLLRPGGHGALLGNLERSAGDLVLVKNIDNVLPGARHAEVARWQSILVGRLLELEARCHELLAALDAAPGDPTLVDQALDFARATFGREAAVSEDPRLAARALAARDLLDRPLRVAGVVPNTGEPGGGPFWVRGADGRTTPQIVEASQVAADDARQLEIWSASTHFNPVQLAVALRDRRGDPRELGRWVDPDTAFVARKNEGGRELVVLERPGLWNGAMAGWLTVFVEIPGPLFAPVKTILDLARPEHAAG